MSGKISGKTIIPTISKAFLNMGDEFSIVVVNHHVSPQRIVTVFFDRRTRRQK